MLASQYTSTISPSITYSSGTGFSLGTTSNTPNINYVSNTNSTSMTYGAIKRQLLQG